MARMPTARYQKPKDRLRSRSTGLHNRLEKARRAEHWWLRGSSGTTHRAPIALYQALGKSSSHYRRAWVLHDYPQGRWSGRFRTPFAVRRLPEALDFDLLRLSTAHWFTARWVSASVPRYLDMPIPREDEIVRWFGGVAPGVLAPRQPALPVRRHLPIYHKVVRTPDRPGMEFLITVTRVRWKSSESLSRAQERQAFPLLGVGQSRVTIRGSQEAAGLSGVLLSAIGLWRSVFWFDQTIAGLCGLRPARQFRSEQ